MIEVGYTLNFTNKKELKSVRYFKQFDPPDFFFMKSFEEDWGMFKEALIESKETQKAIFLFYKKNHFELTYCNLQIEHLTKIKNDVWVCRTKEEFFQLLYIRLKAIDIEKRKGKKKI